MSDRTSEQASTSPPDILTSLDEYDYKVVRDLAREAGITRSVTDEDALAVLEWWLGEPDPNYRPLPSDWNSPEFWAEANRRLENPGRVLDVRTVSEQLRLRWGGAEG